MKIKKNGKPTPEMNALLRRSGSNDPQVAHAAARELAIALTLPLRQGALDGDNRGDIFETIYFEPGTATEFPLDFLSPGSERDFVAFTIPNVGRIPERTVQGDYVMVPTYDIGASIDWSLKYSRDARWDVVGRAMQVLEAMFVLKMNRDAWRVLLASANQRNLVPFDDAATGGLFTKRLVAIMETYMRRNGGGNASSLRRSRLTDLYISPEANQDVLSWDLTQIPDAIRTQIYMNWEEGGVTRIGKVKLHDLDELGVDQEYQDYALDTLGATLPSDKVELVVGLDLQNKDSFVNPVRSEVEIFDDPMFHRQRRAGKYGWQEGGFGSLDSRRVLFGAL